jgi:hypothetical protein
LVPEQILTDVKKRKSLSSTKLLNAHGVKNNYFGQTEIGYIEVRMTGLIWLRIGPRGRIS